MNCSPSDLVLSRPPNPLLREQEPECLSSEYSWQYLNQCKDSLQQVLVVSRQHMTKEPRRYQLILNRLVRLPKHTLWEGSLSLVSQVGQRKDEPTYKLEPIADGSYKFLFINDKTVPFGIEGEVECGTDNFNEEFLRPELIIRHEEPRHDEERKGPDNLGMERGDITPSGIPGMNLRTAGPVRKDLEKRSMWVTLSWITSLTEVCPSAL